MAIPVLECRALSKNYGSFTALSNFNLSLPAGRIIGLLGPNGSGKTTLIKMAAGLLTPTYGEILIDGRPVGIDTNTNSSRTFSISAIRCVDIRTVES